MRIVTLLTSLDLLATFAFALVGARVAASKGLDYGGISLVAAVSSLAGGTFRNIFVGKQPPWIYHPWLFASIALAVVITILSHNAKPIGRFVLSLDTFGLAVATVASANFAISNGIGFVGSVALGLIGGVTGGLLRDLFCQVEPVLLHRETIGTSSIVGAIFYVSLERASVLESVNALISGFVVVIVRELSIKFDIHLPRLR